MSGASKNLTPRNPSRRSVLLAASLTAGSVVLPGLAAFAAAGMRQGQRSGIAFGTTVTLKAAHEDEAILTRALDAAWAEIGAIEGAASLFRPDSALSVLNRTGEVRDPPGALRDLVTTALNVARLSRGAFDPTVQPLWRLHADCRAQGRAPAPAELESLRPLIGYEQVMIDETGIRLARPGMALTLNGIAQGYATDRCLAALAAHGIAHAFLNTGELGAIGRRDGGEQPWTAAIADPRSKDAYAAIVTPVQGVLATSGDYSLSWSDDFSTHHILDPHTLVSPRETAAVSVLASSGAIADALATAMMVLPPGDALDLARRMKAEALIIAKTGERQVTAGFPLAT